MEWMLLPLKRYAEFGGRSRRKEYWMFFLFTLIVSTILNLLDMALGLVVGGEDGVRGTGVLSGVFGLATLVPSIAVGVRRLHDTDRRGWWLLMPVGLLLIGMLFGGVLGGAAGGLAGLSVGMGLAFLAFLIGALVLLVFFSLEGTRGPNRFGADPKDPTGAADLHEVFR